MVHVLPTGKNFRIRINLLKEQSEQPKSLTFSHSKFNKSDGSCLSVMLTIELIIIAIIYPTCIDHLIVLVPKEQLILRFAYLTSDRQKSVWGLQMRCNYLTKTLRLRLRVMVEFDSSSLMAN